MPRVTRHLEAGEGVEGRCSGGVATRSHMSVRARLAMTALPTFEDESDGSSADSIRSVAIIPDESCLRYESVNQRMLQDLNNADV